MLLTLKTELKKAFSNRLFFIAVLIGCVISVAGGAATVYSHFKGTQPFPGENPWLPVSTLYRYWIGDDASNVSPYLFYTLLPLISSLAFGWSYASELKSGYVKNVLTRTKSMYYYISKYIAVFLSGGMVALVPLVLNIILIGNFFPAVVPDPSYEFAYLHLTGTMFTRLYFVHPALYLVAMVLLAFVFSGLYSLLSLTLSYAVKNRVAVTTVPFVLLILVNYATGMFMNFFQNIGELSPLKFLHAATGNLIYLHIAVIEIVILFVLTAGATLIKGVKHDVF